MMTKKQLEQKEIVTAGYANLTSPNFPHFLLLTRQMAIDIVGNYAVDYADTQTPTQGYIADHFSIWESSVNIGNQYTINVYYWLDGKTIKETNRVRVLGYKIIDDSVPLSPRMLSSDEIEKLYEIKIFLLKVVSFCVGKIERADLVCKIVRVKELLQFVNFLLKDIDMLIKKGHDWIIKNRSMDFDTFCEGCIETIKYAAHAKLDAWSYSILLSILDIDGSCRDTPSAKKHKEIYKIFLPR